MWGFRKARAGVAATQPPQPAPAAAARAVDTDQLLAAVREAASATEQDADSAGNASSMVAANVQMVAGMMGEMTSRMSGVKDKVGAARQLVERGASESRNTTSCMQRLSKSVEQIAATAASISEIAAMTNILALNAAIEAARAGDAGAGFAVVANEVKVLAANTARMTAEITKEIDAIRSADHEVGNGVAVINQAFANFETLFAELTAAVDEQTGSLDTVATFAREAVDSVHGLSGALERIAGCARDTVSRCRAPDATTNTPQ